MAKVRARLCPELIRSLMIRRSHSNLLQFIEEYGDKYEATHRFTVKGTGIEAAEEVFDLTNNPSRSEESLDKYGSLRSLNVGDIVVVEEMNDDGSFTEVSYLCENIG